MRNGICEPATKIFLKSSHVKSLNECQQLCREDCAYISYRKNRGCYAFSTCEGSHSSAGLNDYKTYSRG